MEQKYIFLEDNTSSPSASTSIQTTAGAERDGYAPDRSIVRNIINFARCCQGIEVCGMQFKLYLN